MDSEEEINEFREDYLILKPKEATVGDLFKFIIPFSGSKYIRKLIDCPDGKEKYYTKFHARWIIFFTILFLKLLLAIVSLLTILTKFVLTIKRLFFRFIGMFRVRRRQQSPAPYLRTETAEPVVIKHSPTSYYNRPEIRRTSMNNNLKVDYSSSLIRRPKVKCKDWELPDINNDNFRYYGALTMMASNLAYQDYSLIPSVVNNCWKMNLLGCYKFGNDFQGQATTCAFMFQNTAKDPNVTVVAFKGTSPFDLNDWMVDFNFSWHKIKDVGYLHSGFMQALGLQKATGWPNEVPAQAQRGDDGFAYYTLRQKLREIAESNDKAKFIITGHSLGGALAILFVGLLAHHQDSKVLSKIHAVYTYGQPRVGDRSFAEFMIKTIQKYDFRYYRYVYSFDLVPRVPFDSLLFKFRHFGGCVYFNIFHVGQFLRHQPNTNYFCTIFWVIPKYIAALLDLIRSLIITPIFKGRQYIEGFGTIVLRMFGLILPGIAFHIGPNYINVTRWGKFLSVPDDKKLRLYAQNIEPDY